MTIRDVILCGTVLAVGLAVGTVPSSAAEFRVVHSFGSGQDGKNPNVGLVEVNNTLYGTTMGGGTHSAGTVFMLDAANGNETVVYNFIDFADGLGASNLIGAGGLLYGTAGTGGSNGYGTVFSIDPSAGTKTVLHSFPAFEHDGNTPAAGLIKVGRLLYGTTQFGGTQNNGAVFSVNAKTGQERVVYSFAGGSDGASPMASLVNVGGVLYGTTLVGGSANCRGGCGTIFSVDPGNGVETVVYAFQGGSDGSYPVAGLIDTDGTLYGTTTGFTAPSGVGAVFSLTLATKAFDVLYTFTNPANGTYPAANLLSVAGILYGTTENGGTGTCNGGTCGTVFSVNPASGQETVLQDLSDADGFSPSSALIKVHKALYGTAYGGGANGYGTIFAVKP